MVDNNVYDTVVNHCYLVMDKYSSKLKMAKKAMKEVTKDKALPMAQLLCDYSLIQTPDTRYLQAIKAMHKVDASKADIMRNIFSNPWLMLDKEGRFEQVVKLVLELPLDRLKAMKDIFIDSNLIQRDHDANMLQEAIKIMQDIDLKKAKYMSMVLTSCGLIYDKETRYEDAIKIIQELNDEEVMKPVSTVIADSGLLEDKKLYDHALNIILNTDKNKMNGMAEVLTCDILYKNNPNRYHLAVQTVKDVEPIYVVPRVLKYDWLVFDENSKYEQAVNALHEVDPDMMDVLSWVLLDHNLISLNDGKYEKAISMILNATKENANHLLYALDSKRLIELDYNKYVTIIDEVNDYIVSNNQIDDMEVRNFYIKKLKPIKKKK